MEPKDLRPTTARMASQPQPTDDEKNKNKETGWIDSNVFQYIYRPEQCDFDTVCVWEYFQNYEMRLISSLSTNQRESVLFFPVGGSTIKLTKQSSYD